MGEAAEEMAERNGISREAQDQLALDSHHKAAAAREAGVFDEEVVPVVVGEETIHRDGMIRADTSLEKLAKLRPVF